MTKHLSRLRAKFCSAYASISPREIAKRSSYIFIVAEGEDMALEGKTQELVSMALNILENMKSPHPAWGFGVTLPPTGLSPGDSENSRLPKPLVEEGQSGFLLESSGRSKPVTGYLLAYHPH